MKKIILNFDELTNSKEYYSRRPNPAAVIFIYCILALLTAALTYSYFGKIEIVASAMGTILPNEQIGSVACLPGGRIVAIDYLDGQTVRKDDILLVVDNTELQLQLAYLQENQREAALQYEMQEKYVLSLQQGVNLFASDPTGEEYPFYVMYENYALSLLDSENSLVYEEGKIRENIGSLNRQIEELQDQMTGLRLFKESIETDSNKAEQYPVYSNRFLQYEAALAGMELEYESKRRSLEADTSASSNTAALAYCKEQIQGYTMLLNSINTGKNAFDKEDNSIYHGLYKDYLYQTEHYQGIYERERDNHEFLRDNRSNNQPMEQYQQTMLEGYILFRQSVNNNYDAFSAGAASYAYRYLYTNYQAQYEALNAVFDAAVRDYEALLAGGGDERAIQAAVEAMRVARSLVDEHKQSTLANINNQILQINSSLGENNLKTSEAAEDLRIKQAKTDEESAKEAVTAYKNKMLVEYGDTLTQLKAKERELQYSLEGMIPKETLIADLDFFYQQGLLEKRITVQTEIDSSLLSMENQLNTLDSSLRLNLLAEEMYSSNRGRNTAERYQPLSISFMRLKAVEDGLSNKESMKNALMDLDNKIEQTQQQIEACTTRATRTGIINRHKDVGIGDIVGVGEVLATIVPQDESAYRVQLYVSNKDIAGIEEGKRVKYNIMALPSRQYGTIEGNITYISKDTLIQDNQRSGYYVVEGTIHAGTVVDSDGNQATITTGMQVEGKIVTQQKRIINFLLEKINLN